MANPERITDKGCAERILNGAGTGIGLGVVASGIIVAWKGPLERTAPTAIFRSYGRILIPAAALVGTLFATGDCLSESVRAEKSMLNAAAGGCIAGASMGLFRKKVTSGIYGCAMFGAAAAAVDAKQHLWRPPVLEDSKLHNLDNQATPGAITDYLANRRSA